MKGLEAFILAGGNSSRMGNDKSLLEIGGRSFLEIIGSELAHIAPGRVKIVGGKMDKCDFQCVSDVFNTTRRAALVGLHAALFHAVADWVIIVACDMPFVQHKMFELLASKISDDIDTVVPIDKGGKRQPLCALYRRQTCCEMAERSLNENKWSIGHFLDGIAAEYVPFEEFASFDKAAQLFANINTPEDFRLAANSKHETGV